MFLEVADDEGRMGRRDHLDVREMLLEAGHQAKLCHSGWRWLSISSIRRSAGFVFAVSHVGMDFGEALDEDAGQPMVEFIPWLT